MGWGWECPEVKGQSRSLHVEKGQARARLQEVHLVPKRVRRRCARAWAPREQEEDTPLLPQLQRAALETGPSRLVRARSLNPAPPVRLQPGFG